MVWGTFLEKNFPSSNGHLLDFGVLGHLFRENGKTNGKKGKRVKLRLKKSAVFECGGRGCNCYLGNAHIEVAPT